MGEHLSITDISRQTTIPETTIRRYINLFYDFIGSKEKTVSARNKRYSREVLDILNKIYSLYAQGKGTNEIYDLLKSNFSHTVEVQTTEQTAVTNNVAMQNMYNFIGLVKNQTNIIYEIKNQLDEMKESNETKINQLETDIKNILHQQIKAIEQTAADVKNAVADDKEKQKEYIEERDALILKQMRRVFEENKQNRFSFFKKWWQNKESGD